MKLYLSDFFDLPSEIVERFGAFNVSLVSDLPLFIDPFLLFNSKKESYQQLHRAIIDYLRFLREKSSGGPVEEGLLQAWYRFPEIGQTWLGFTFRGNAGSGLGREFAHALNANLGAIFRDFGNEQLTKSSHLEKLCLIAKGVGKDHISDFATNLIHGYLLEYTQAFALKHVDASRRKRTTVDRVRFNYATETWDRAEFDLPWFGETYVLLVPKDILTKDETWINKHDMIEDFRSIPDALPNEALRAQINNYFQMLLPKKAKKRDEDEAAFKTIQKYPELIDAFIKLKEEDGDRAVSVSSRKVAESRQLYFSQFKEFVNRLESETGFYQTSGRTYDEAMERVRFMKDLIENKGAHRMFYVSGKPVRKEEDLQILYRFTWCESVSNVSREVNDGRGPADYLVSMGASDKTIVEFKLASNGQLKRNLAKQAEVYQKASDAKRAIKVILFFSKEEQARVRKIQKELGLENSGDVILIDARTDNKPSGSKA